VRHSAFDFDRHPRSGVPLVGGIFEGWKDNPRRDTTDKRSAIGMRRSLRIQPVFEMNLVHSGWRNCFVSCAVVVGIQQCAGNVLYPLVHRTFQSHIYRTDADMFGEFSLDRVMDRGRRLA